MAFDVEKSFIRNSKYLSNLVKSIKDKDISDLNNNMIYEISYAKRYIDSIYYEENSSLNKDNIYDIKKVLDVIWVSIPDKMAVKGVDDKEDPVIEDLLLDSDRLKKFKRVDIFLNSELKNSGSLDVFGKYAFRVVLMGILFLAMPFILRIIPEFFNRIFSEISETGKEGLQTITKVYTILIGFVTMALFMCTVLRSMVSILYVMFPAIRNMPLFLRIVDDELKDEYGANNIGVNPYSFIGRSNTILSWWRDIKKGMQGWKKSKDGDYLVSHKDIKTIDNKLKNDVGKEYISVLSEIEVLYERYQGKFTS